MKGLFENIDTNDILYLREIKLTKNYERKYGQYHWKWSLENNLRGF